MADDKSPTRPFFFFFFTSCLCSYPLCDSLTLLWLVVTSWSLLWSTCPCLCVTGCLCLYPAAGHELIIRTQGFSVLITKLWHHHITHSTLTDKLYNPTHWFKGKSLWLLHINNQNVQQCGAPTHSFACAIQCACKCVSKWMKESQRPWWYCHDVAFHIKKYVLTLHLSLFIYF